MTTDIKLIGYDYTNKLHQYVAVDPETKALLTKGIEGGVSDHGQLTGLDDDDHTQYLHLNKVGQELEQDLIVGDTITIDGLDISAHKSAYDSHVANANAHHAQTHTLASHSTRAHSELTGVSTSQHHVKTSNLSEISINEHKDWGAMHLLNVGNIECRGATLVAGVQSQGRCSVYMRDANTFYEDGDSACSYVPFRQEMTNIPSSITLTDAPETEHWRDKNNTVQKITRYGFEFRIESDGTGDTFTVGSKKYVTVGN